MNPRITTYGRVLVALVAVSALSLSGTVAEAGNGHGHGKSRHKHKVKHARYVSYDECGPREVVVVDRPAYVVRQAPVYEACAPRYVSSYSPRVVVVRPAPYVSVGARIGSVDIAAVFGPRRQYAQYEYGCNFCEAHFSTFAAYDVHVHGCDYRPHDVRIQARVWDDEGYGEWRGRDDRYYEEDDRYDG